MLQLNIVTPDKPFYEEEVDMVIVRGIEGDLAVMKNTSPITTPLRIGAIRIFKGDEEKVAAVVDGYLTVVDNVATVVTESAEWPHEIDVERAEAAKRRAEERLKNQKSEIDVLRAEMALKRAINRLDISKYSKM